MLMNSIMPEYLETLTVGGSSGLRSIVDPIPLSHQPVEISRHLLQQRLYFFHTLQDQA